jgi:hypothetical protein
MVDYNKLFYLEPNSFNTILSGCRGENKQERSYSR